MTPIIENLFKKATDYNQKFHNNLRKVIHPKFNKISGTGNNPPQRRFKPNIPGKSLAGGITINDITNNHSRSRWPSPSCPLQASASISNFRPNIPEMRNSDSINTLASATLNGK